MFSNSCSQVDEQCREVSDMNNSRLAAGEGYSVCSIVMHTIPLKSKRPFQRHYIHPGSKNIDVELGNSISN